MQKQKHGESVLPTKFKGRIPIVGTLKIGDVEDKGGTARPKKLDHMRLCGASATARGNYPDHPAMAEFNGAKAKSITIELVSDDPSVNLEVVYAMSGRGAILCRGNGTTAERRLDARGAMTADAPFSPVAEGTCGESCEFFKRGACKLASTLRFRIPGHTDLGSLWHMRTTSWNTAQDLLGAQQAIAALTGGSLARIPLRLFMTEQHRKALTEKGRTSSNFWTLGLSFEGSEEDLIAAVAKAQKLKADMAAVAMPTLEDRLKAQKPELLADDLPAAEELAFAAEFSDLPTQLPASPEAPNPQAPEGAASDAPGPAEEAPSSNAVGDPAGSEGEAQAIAAASPSQPEAQAEAPAPPPAESGSSKEPRITDPQRNLLLKHSGRVKGLNRSELEAKLGGLSKREASDLITSVLTDAEGAFTKLGVVA